MQGLVAQFRLAELNAVKSWLRPGLRVLEIGGGDGWQASIMASWGCQLTSVDLPDRPFSEPYYFPVQNYDGVHLPAATGSCDLVFSSNVLEHVRDLPPLLAEMRRVLKPEGLAIHILPTPTWRFWTSVTHYGGMARLLRARLRPPHDAVAAAPPGGADVPPPAQTPRPARPLTQKVRDKLVAGPHGEYPNALTELYYFSQRRWLRVFAAHGFVVREVAGTALFYTGYNLLPGLSLAARRTVARWLGPACRIYIMELARP